MYMGIMRLRLMLKKIPIPYGSQSVMRLKKSVAPAKAGVQRIEATGFRPSPE
jgi:hypothetical protein